MTIQLTPENTLPGDGLAGTLVGRVWVSGAIDGPCVVLLTEFGVINITGRFPTMADLLAEENPAVSAAEAFDPINKIGDLEDILANSGSAAPSPETPHLLAPIDLQAIKAAGVTFVLSMLERVIEEKAAGDMSAAESIRQTINAEIGDDLASVVPGSEAAEKLKSALQARGMWSQYLEVGIGPFAEVFSKAQPMSAMGSGADVGLHPLSNWNNPEPEVVLIIGPHGRIVGATLGNDVNLRDFEGRSALLLGRAKDNNASASVGPFIRLVDQTFTLDDIRAQDLNMTIEGTDGFRLEGSSNMGLISRDIEDLAAQTIGKNHQYPDGLALYTGTSFAPIEDRDTPGQGFTHKVGDIVTITAPKLGGLINRVDRSDNLPPWTFGAGALMRNLARRGLLQR